jgi:hypothetical protein
MFRHTETSAVLQHSTRPNKYSKWPIRSGTEPRKEFGLNAGSATKMPRQTHKLKDLQHSLSINGKIQFLKQLTDTHNGMNQ